MRLSIPDIKENIDLMVYFNWSCNALMPVYSGAADRYFTLHRESIVNTARQFIDQLNYQPGTIYRGIILREPIKQLAPHSFMKYLSFSTDIQVARHFANVNGFGSEICDLKQKLGTYGYVIEYTPKKQEVLFHHELLNLLPYAEAFIAIGLDGEKEIAGLRKQMEIMIQQPEQPLINVTAF